MCHHPRTPVTIQPAAGLPSSQLAEARDLDEPREARGAESVANTITSRDVRRRTAGGHLEPFGVGRQSQTSCLSRRRLGNWQFVQLTR